MSRFKTASIATAVLLLIIALVFTGGQKWLFLAAATIAYLVLVGLGVAFIKMRFFCNALCNGTTGKMQVALTFDDGPDPLATPLLLDELKRTKVPAAFFCVGRKVLDNPALVKRILDEGHVIGNHTFSHKWWTNFMFGKLLFDEIARAQAAIKNVVDYEPAYFRPPVGLTNPHFDGALKKMRLTMVGWSVRSFDRLCSNPAKVVDRIVNKTHDGAVIVLHDGDATPDFLVNVVSRVVRILRQRGYTFVGLDALFGKDP